MAHIRCSNCRKSIEERTKEKKTVISPFCLATGEKIVKNKKKPNERDPYFQIRKCNEFIPRQEYEDQFGNPLDKTVEMIEKGKKIKDILDPL